VADIDIVMPDRIAETLDRLRNNDLRYRFVLDLAAIGSLTNA
jgi:hypothetical protein